MDEWKEQDMINRQREDDLRTETTFRNKLRATYVFLNNPIADPVLTLLLNKQLRETISENDRTQLTGYVEAGLFRDLFNLISLFS